MARLVVGHAAGGRKPGRGRGGQEVERHLLPRHTPQNPTTHFPTFPHIFLHSRTFSYAFSVFSETPTVCTRAVGWETGIVLSLWRARQSYTRLRVSNPTQSYTTLHPSACLAILQLRRNPTFPCNSPQICQNLLKGLFSFETQAKPC